MLFSELGLSPEVLQGVEAMGYESPTPIQAQSIPAILEGRDIVGASQTGTGKTAAFALPILSQLSGKEGRLRCLVLEPTRELAAQVAEAFEELGKFSKLRALLVHGGVGYGKQREGLDQGFEIVLATPGRLLDLAAQGAVNLKNCDIVVLDEVDRMLDMGFLPDVRKIVKMCAENRQTLLFSATMPAQIDSLAKWALKDPLEVEIGRRSSVAETVTHAFYPVSIDQREGMLMELLSRTDFKSVMIFTRTKADADKLTRLIRNECDYKVTVLHGDIKQSDREKALKGFRDGTFDVIIATDIAARGLDVSGVTHVINYQVPENAEDYVHRIGRTGRADSEGDAFTILTAPELEFAESIERYIDQKIERRKLDNFDYIYTSLLETEKPRPIKRVRRGAPRRRRK
ncbi:MAG: ATP-dependent RNA helicase RhlE [Verrucomicrobiales bacterium]|jgi:ATP-dependent RNA helicase RhlE